MIVEGYGRKRYKADFIKHLTYSQAEGDETILYLDFPAITQGFNGLSVKNHAMNNDVLSKWINKFIPWMNQVGMTLTMTLTLHK